jgi:hypothetical protein
MIPGNQDSAICYQKTVFMDSRLRGNDCLVFPAGGPVLRILSGYDCTRELLWRRGVSLGEHCGVHPLPSLSGHSSYPVQDRVFLKTRHNPLAGFFLPGGLFFGVYMCQYSLKSHEYKQKASIVV